MCNFQVPGTNCSAPCGGYSVCQFYHSLRPREVPSGGPCLLPWANPLPWRAGAAEAIPVKFVPAALFPVLPEVNILAPATLLPFLCPVVLIVQKVVPVGAPMLSWLPLRGLTHYGQTLAAFPGAARLPVAALASLLSVPFGHLRPCSCLLKGPGGVLVPLQWCPFSSCWGGVESGRWLEGL